MTPGGVFRRAVGGARMARHAGQTSMPAGTGSSHFGHEPCWLIAGINHPSSDAYYTRPADLLHHEEGITALPGMRTPEHGAGDGIPRDLFDAYLGHDGIIPQHLDIIADPHR